MSRPITEYCPGCRERRPIKDFIGVDHDLSYGSPAPVCRLCKEKGPPPKEPAVMQDLNILHRKILKALLLTGNYAETARLAGCSYSYVRRLVKGHGGGNEDFRRAFQMMLETEGLDYYSIVRMAKLLLYSEEPKWNPKTEEWDSFPDNKTRLGMLRHLTKVRELDPPTANNFPQPVTVVNIETNVGGDAQPRDAPGSFTIEAGELVNAPRIEEGADGGG
jgi:hypothetical protein